jgi:hypothetical protein
MAGEDVCGKMKLFSRLDNLFLPTGLLFGNLVPDELQLAVLHLLLVYLDVFLQMIAAGESLRAVEALVGLDTWKRSRFINYLGRFSRLKHFLFTHLNEIFDDELFRFMFAEGENRFSRVSSRLRGARRGLK